MQDPDRLNGGSLPINGGRLPVPDFDPFASDTLPGAPPTPMPDYMRELLDQIKASSPKAAPAQPAPAQPAPVPIQPTPVTAPATGAPSWIPQSFMDFAQ